MWETETPVVHRSSTIGLSLVVVVLPWLQPALRLSKCPLTPPLIAHILHPPPTPPPSPPLPSPHHNLPPFSPTQTPPHTNTPPLQVGRAKDKLLEADKKKRRALDKFVSFVRSAEGLYTSTTWEEFEEAFNGEEEFLAVSVGLCLWGGGRGVWGVLSVGWVCACVCVWGMTGVADGRGVVMGR